MAEGAPSAMNLFGTMAGVVTSAMNLSWLKSCPLKADLAGGSESVLRSRPISPEMAEVISPEKQHKKKRREKDDEDGSKKKKKKKVKKRHHDKDEGKAVETITMPEADAIDLLKHHPPASPHPTYVASGTPLHHAQQDQPNQEQDALQEQKQQQKVVAEEAADAEVEQVTGPPPSIGPPPLTPARRAIEEIGEKMERMRDRYRQGTLQLVSVFQFVRADVGGHGFVSFVVPTMHAFHDTLIEYFNNPQAHHPAEAMRLAQNVGENRSLEACELAAYIGSLVIPEDTPGVWACLISSKP
jgi:hypothetical protein